MDASEHWDHVYTHKRSDAVSWYQPHAERSLQLIEQAGIAQGAAIIDIGGGTSTLVDDLLARGFANLTVLDLSHAALQTARERLGPHADQVLWRVADVTTADLPHHGYDLWHDRAVFHFLVSPEARRAYVRQVLRAVRPGGHVIVATFAEDGPLQCSGLPVMRYDADGLHAEFGAAFTLVGHEREAHHTPLGSTQQFTYCYCRRALA